MSVSELDLAQKVAAQSAAIPSVYGKADLSVIPERFTTDPQAKTVLRPEFAYRREELLRNTSLVDLIRAYTMIGDEVADAYAALMPEYGFRRLVSMLSDACSNGVEAVPGAPPELSRLIGQMATTPPWLDRQLIERGAKLERSGYANRAPFVIRGALLSTFMNKYSALPMAITGTLSSETAARRIKETATFFTATVMPGALDRHGAGFKAAAMVRLMHSMVRFNVLRSGKAWDVKTYGVPIPQVDQMPAGLVVPMQLSQRALKQGRTSFTPDERARVELARYRCYLLGLPRELLADTPQEIVDILQTRHATLRKEFDATCASLVEATMAADLTANNTLADRFHAWMERGFGKIYFVKMFMGGDKAAAAKVGVQVSVEDKIAAAVAAAVMGFNTGLYAMASRIPIVSEMADRSLVKKIETLLASYGHAEFTTDASGYSSAKT